MNWREISKDKSQEKYEEYCKSKEVDCPAEFGNLRKKLQEQFVLTLSELSIDVEDIEKNKYQVDLVYGLRIYKLLNESFEMNVRTASSEGVWRFLSVCVAPDVIEMRYGIEAQDRFWKKPKRLWFRVLWWYIHLSWQGSEEATKKVLKDNSTDEILQLVDRCGRDGYRVDLYRQIMKKYSELDPVERRKTQIFRKMMVLNTAKVQVIEPALVDGGEELYVDGLCNYFGYDWM